MPRFPLPSLIAGLLAVMLVSGAAAQKAPRFKLIIPPDEALAIMIKTTLIAFNNANLTGNYSVLRDLAAPSFSEANNQARLAEMATFAHGLGLEVHAGHGLTYDTVAPVAALPELMELNIGHFLIGEAIFIGLDAAIREMRRRMDEARR